MTIGESNYPTSIDTVHELVQAVNRTSTLLAGSINAAVTTILVDDASDAPGSGIAWIDAEAISYTGKTGNQLTGCTRGFDNTVATEHSNGVTVYFDVISAAHHKALVDAIIAIETKLGTGPLVSMLRVAEGGVIRDETVSLIDFDASDFNVSEVVEDEVSVGLAYGTSAGTPAEGNHLHTGVYQPLDADLTDIANVADAQGDILIRGASGWERLPAGAAGERLATQGAGANPIWTAPAPTLYVPFLTRSGNEGGANFIWTNQPSGIDELLGQTKHRRVIDLTGATQVLIAAEMDAAGSTNAIIRLNYAQNLTSPVWTAVTATNLSIASTGVLNTGWVTWPAAGRQLVLIRIVGENGNGTADPQFMNLFVQFK